MPQRMGDKTATKRLTSSEGLRNRLKKWLGEDWALRLGFLAFLVALLVLAIFAG